MTESLNPQEYAPATFDEETARLTTGYFEAMLTDNEQDAQDMAFQAMQQIHTGLENNPAETAGPALVLAAEAVGVSGGSVVDQAAQSVLELSGTLSREHQDAFSQLVGEMRSGQSAGMSVDELQQHFSGRFNKLDHGQDGTEQGLALGMAAFGSSFFRADGVTRDHYKAIVYKHMGVEA